MSSSSPTKESEHPKDVPVTTQDTLGTADRTTPTHSNSSLEQDGQENQMPHEENIGTSSSNEGQANLQDQTELEFEQSMEVLDAEIAQQDLEERQNLLAVVAHRSDVPTSDIEQIILQMESIYHTINQNRLLGSYDSGEERQDIANLTQLCQEAPMEEEIVFAIFIAFEENGKRQVIMDSEVSQAERCWNKFKMHCRTNHPVYKKLSADLENIPLVMEELYRKMQTLLKALVKLLFNVELSSPGRHADYSRRNAGQDYVYNTIPKQNKQLHIMAEKQPILLLSDTFLVQLYAQIIRGRYNRHILYGLNALGLGLHIKKTTFKTQLMNQKEAKLNALKCSYEMKQVVEFDTYHFQKEVGNMLPVIGSPLYLISNKAGTKSSEGVIIPSSMYKDGIITANGLVLLAEDTTGETFAMFAVEDFKTEDQVDQYNYQDIPQGTLPAYIMPTKDMPLKFRMDRGCKNDPHFEMDRYWNRFNNCEHHHGRRTYSRKECHSPRDPELINMRAFYVGRINDLRKINTEMGELNPTETPDTSENDSSGDDSSKNNSQAKEGSILGEVAMVDNPLAQDDNEQDNNIDISEEDKQSMEYKQVHLAAVRIGPKRETVVDSIFSGSESLLNPFNETTGGSQAYMDSKNTEIMKCNSSPYSSIRENKSQEGEGEDNDNQAGLSQSIGSNTTIPLEQNYARDSSAFQHQQQNQTNERTATTDRHVEEETAEKLRVKLDKQLSDRRIEIETLIEERKQSAQATRRKEEDKMAARKREDEAHKYIAKKVEEDKLKEELQRKFDEDMRALEAQLTLPTVAAPTSPLTASVGPQDATKNSVHIKTEVPAKGKDVHDKRKTSDRKREESPDSDRKNRNARTVPPSFNAASGQEHNKERRGRGEDRDTHRQRKDSGDTRSRESSTQKHVPPAYRGTRPFPRNDNGRIITPSDDEGSRRRGGFDPRGDQDINSRDRDNMPRKDNPLPSQRPTERYKPQERDYSGRSLERSRSPRDSDRTANKGDRGPEQSRQIFESSEQESYMIHEHILCNADLGEGSEQGLTPPRDISNAPSVTQYDLARYLSTQDSTYDNTLAEGITRLRSMAVLEPVREADTLESLQKSRRSRKEKLNQLVSQLIQENQNPRREIRAHRILRHALVQAEMQVLSLITIPRLQQRIDWVERGDGGGKHDSNVSWDSEDENTEPFHNLSLHNPNPTHLKGGLETPPQSLDSQSPAHGISPARGQLSHVEIQNIINRRRIDTTLPVRQPRTTGSPKGLECSSNIDEMFDFDSFNQDNKPVVNNNTLFMTSQFLDKQHTQRNEAQRIDRQDDRRHARKGPEYMLNNPKISRNAQPSDVQEHLDEQYMAKVNKVDGLNYHIRKLRVIYQDHIDKNIKVPNTHPTYVLRRILESIQSLNKKATKLSQDIHAYDQAGIGNSQNLSGWDLHLSNQSRDSTRSKFEKWCQDNNLSSSTNFARTSYQNLQEHVALETSKERNDSLHLTGNCQEFVSAELQTLRDEENTTYWNRTGQAALTAENEFGQTAPDYYNSPHTKTSAQQMNRIEVIGYGKTRFNLEVQNSVSHTQFLSTVEDHMANYIGKAYMLENEDRVRNVSTWDEIRKYLDKRDAIADKKEPHLHRNDNGDWDWDNHVTNSRNQGVNPFTTPYDSVPRKPQTNQQRPYPEPNNSYPTGTPGATLPRTPQPSHQYPYPEPDNSYTPGKPDATPNSNPTILPIDLTKRETLGEECLRLIAEIVVDRNTSYGACKDQFEKDIGPSFRIIFNKISTRPSKDVEKDWVGVFDPANKYETIVDFLKKASYYAKHRLGGIHGIEGWGSFLVFLRNGNQMNDLAKARLTTMQRMNLPGTEIYAGNITEQQAAVQSYKLALLYYQTFKFSNESDTSMFHQSLTTTGNGPLDFSGGITLWETCLQGHLSLSTSTKILQRTLLEAIMRKNGPEGLKLKERLEHKITLLTLKGEYLQWETDPDKHIRLLDEAVRKLHEEEKDNLTSNPTVTNSRSRRLGDIKVHNTSMHEYESATEGLTRRGVSLDGRSVLGNSSDEEDEPEYMEQERMDGHPGIQEQWRLNNIDNVDPLMVNSFQYNDQRLHPGAPTRDCSKGSGVDNRTGRGPDRNIGAGHSQDRNGGRGYNYNASYNAGPGRGYDTGRGYDAGRGTGGRNTGRGNGTGIPQGDPTRYHTSCMSCGGSHAWPVCPFKLEGNTNNNGRIGEAGRYRMDSAKLFAMELTKALEIVKSSTEQGNMRFQSEETRRSLVDQLKVNQANKNRPTTTATDTTTQKPLVSTTQGNPTNQPRNTQNITVASCILAISESINNIQQPVFGLYNGQWSIRPQLPYSNDVLAHVWASISQATPEQINQELLGHPGNQVPETMTEEILPYLYLEDIPDNTALRTENTASRKSEASKGPREGSSICLIDGGSTPTVITRKIAEDLGLSQEKSHRKLGVSGVFGDVQQFETICWITITFGDQVQITAMAIVVEHMSSPVLIGQTDFLRNQISHITGINSLIFGNHNDPYHTEKLMTETNLENAPNSGYTLHARA
jgi:hypothetical protein